MAEHRFWWVKMLFWPQVVHEVSESELSSMIFSSSLVYDISLS